MVVPILFTISVLLLSPCPCNLASMYLHEKHSDHIWSARSTLLLASLMEQLTSWFLWMLNRCEVLSSYHPSLAKNQLTTVLTCTGWVQHTHTLALPLQRVAPFSWSFVWQGERKGRSNIVSHTTSGNTCLCSPSVCVYAGLWSNLLKYIRTLRYFIEFSIRVQAYSEPDPLDTLHL